MVKFSISSKDAEMISEIADRAEVAGMIYENYDRMTLVMDLTACHANGCPLDFKRLYEADGFNFAHDICGIARYMDRDTGQLTNFFRPRTSI